MGSEAELSVIGAATTSVPTQYSSATMTKEATIASGVQSRFTGMVIDLTRDELMKSVNPKRIDPVGSSALLGIGVAISSET
jgi:hypothetical protein